MDRRRRLRDAFAPILGQIAERCSVADAFIDKDVYRVYVATLWANVVTDPVDVGIEEADIEIVHDVLNEEIARVLGPGFDVTGCFRFLATKDGEAAMRELRLTPEHKDLLMYFHSMIVDPEGHKKWMDEIRARQRARQ